MIARTLYRFTYLLTILRETRMLADDLGRLFLFYNYWSRGWQGFLLVWLLVFNACRNLVVKIGNQRRRFGPLFWWRLVDSFEEQGREQSSEKHYLDE
jgi:hypothetical protein